jgi:hypothetical protein
VLTKVEDLTSLTVGMYAAAPGTLATLIVQDLTYTSIAEGPFGNSITIAYVNPGVPSSPLSVDVTGTAITVSPSDQRRQCTHLDCDCDCRSH